MYRIWENIFLSHHGVRTGRQLKEVQHHSSWEYLHLSLEVARPTHPKDHSRPVHMFVFVEFRFIAWGDIETSDLFGVNLYRRTPPRTVWTSRSKYLCGLRTMS